MGEVLVMGSANTDLTLRLPRLPRPGETQLGGEFRQSRGGKGANQAVAARRAGAAVRFLAAVGDDPHGRQILRSLDDEGVDTSLARVKPGAASGVALILVSEQGENLIGVAPGANSALSVRDVEELADEVFQPPGWLLASLEVPVDSVAAAVRRAKDSGLRVALNAAPMTEAVHDFELLELLDLLIVNQSEAEQLTECLFDTLEWAGRAAVGVRMRFKCNVVITLGGEGWALSASAGAVASRAFAVEVVDTVGAGDVFCGALVSALARGVEPLAATHWASAAAALAVTRPGVQDACPTQHEIDRLADSRSIDDHLVWRGTA